MNANVEIKDNAGPEDRSNNCTPANNNDLKESNDDTDEHEDEEKSHFSGLALRKIVKIIC